MANKILVADDSPTELRVVMNVLQKKGYQLIVAKDGDEAISKATNEHPQLAILDIVMPGKNGFQVTRQLKNAPETKDIKVLLLSSKNQESDRFWGMKQGADDYITKPFEEQALLSAVAKLL